MKVFVSYSARQKLFVREFLGYCPDSIDFWVDEKTIIAGEDIRSKIDTALDGSCDFVALFLEEHAACSAWVEYEIARTLEIEKQQSRAILIPIVLSERAWLMLSEVIGPNRKYIKCYDQLDDSIRMAANRFTESLFDWLITISSKKDDGQVNLDKKNFKEAEETFRSLAKDFKSIIHKYRRSNPITIEELFSEEFKQTTHDFQNIDDLNYALSELFRKGYMSGYYFDGDIAFLVNEKFVQKTEVDDEVKRWIAKEAITYVDDDMSIAIDGGTTTFAAAAEIAKLLTAGAIVGLDIFTNSIPVAQVILEALNKLNVSDRDATCQVTIMGGRCRANSMCSLAEGQGSLPAFDMLFPNSMGNVDIAFMGASGVTGVEGFGITHKYELPAKRSFYNAAKKVVMLCDGGKFSLQQPNMFAPFSEKMMVLTDKSAHKRVEEIKGESETLRGMTVIFCDD